MKIPNTEDLFPRIFNPKQISGSAGDFYQALLHLYIVKRLSILELLVCYVIFLIDKFAIAELVYCLSIIIQIKG